MKLIIAGSRNFINLPIGFIDQCLKAFGLTPSYVVCGMAKGVDMEGEFWADQNGIPVLHFHAEWEKYGNRAGPIRNAKMAAIGDELLLIWDGLSPGSSNMKKQMLDLGKPVHEIILRSSNEEK
jgi:hypothetical protein